MEIITPRMLASKARGAEGIFYAMRACMLSSSGLSKRNFWFEHIQLNVEIPFLDLTLYDPSM